MQLYPLNLWPNKSQFHFVKYKKVIYFFSTVSTLVSIILLFTMKLNFGIDFVGGTNIEISSIKPIDNIALSKRLKSLDIGEVTIQNFSNSEAAIKISTIGNTQQIQDIIQEVVTAPEYKKIEVVGPQVGKYMINSGIKAVVLCFAAIMAYIWFRFEWQFSLGIIIALAHDLILSLGFMSLTRLDFNLSSIAAILTFIGYSVNDSIVIYDRIRDNLRKYRNQSLSDIIDSSINTTLSRTTLTVLTTLIANLILIILGTEAIRSFSILVFFGILAGTYSSIFVSALILTSLNLKK